MNSQMVSIIITNYNYSKYLADCIRSCLDQKTTTPYEVLLVDDGSTDDSLDIATSFAADRLKIIMRQNGGIEAASNEGIEKSQGEFIVRVDADDYLLPGFLEEIVNRLIGSTCHFAYSNYQVVDECNNILSCEELPSFDKNEILNRGDFLATGTVYNRSIVLKQGGYNEATPNCGLENYELILKLVQSGSMGLHIGENLFAYRLHGNNISTKRRSEIISYGKRLFNSLSMGTYSTNRFHPYKLDLNI